MKKSWFFRAFESVLEIALIVLIGVFCVGACLSWEEFRAVASILFALVLMLSLIFLASKME